jgi:hypothetical protein
MKLKTFIVPAIMLIGLAASPNPALADNRSHGRGGGGGGAVARGQAHARPHADFQRAVPRAAAVPRAEGPRIVAGRPHIDGARPYRGGYGYRPYYGRPYGYRGYGYRPYAYTFRPRLSIGLGVYLGYPVPYPYYDPFYYPAPSYAYPTPGSVAVPSPGIGYGGVSLDITPNDAAVTVDGNLAGTVDDFNDPSHPMSLPVGRHNVQIRAPGYVTLVFDVDVVAGQVTPYQGDLQHN